MKLTLNQKRFLIIWVLFNSFALFVNITDIRGIIEDNSENTIYLFNSGTYEGDPHNSDFWPFTSYYYDEPQTIKAPELFPDSVKAIIKKVEPEYKIGIHSKTGKKVRIPTGLEETVRFFNNPRNKDVNIIPTDSTVTDFSSDIREVVGISHAYYGGLFNSYGVPEYIFYMCLGFAIIYLPRSLKAKPIVKEKPPKADVDIFEVVFGTYVYIDKRLEYTNRKIKSNLLVLAVQHPEIDFTNLWLLYEDRFGRITCDIIPDYTEGELESKINFIIRATIIGFEKENPKRADISP